MFWLPMTLFLSRKCSYLDGILFRKQRMRKLQDFIQMYQFDNSHFLPLKITATAAHLFIVFIFTHSIPLK